jgi:hypothetical protein
MGSSQFSTSSKVGWRPRLVLVRPHDLSGLPHQDRDSRLGKQFPQERNRQQVERSLLTPSSFACTARGSTEQLLDEAAKDADELVAFPEVATHGSLPEDTAAAN